jgi:hypothetical protein
MYFVRRVHVFGCTWLHFPLLHDGDRADQSVALENEVQNAGKGSGLAVAPVRTAISSANEDFNEADKESKRKAIRISVDMRLRKKAKGRIS